MVSFRRSLLGRMFRIIIHVLYTDKLNDACNYVLFLQVLVFSANQEGSNRGPTELYGKHCCPAGLSFGAMYVWYESVSVPEVLTPVHHNVLNLLVTLFLLCLCFVMFLIIDMIIFPASINLFKNALKRSWIAFLLFYFFTVLGDPLILYILYTYCMHLLIVDSEVNAHCYDWLTVVYVWQPTSFTNGRCFDLG